MKVSLALFWLTGVIRTFARSSRNTVVAVVEYFALRMAIKTRHNKSSIAPIVRMPTLDMAWSDTSGT